MRTSKAARKENARRFYKTFMNSDCNKVAIVVQRNESTTNPNVNRVQFLAIVPVLAFMKRPVVIAESGTDGIKGCFMELFGFIKDVPQKLYYEDDFNEWMKDTYGFEITYKDGLVFMLEK